MWISKRAYDALLAAHERELEAMTAEKDRLARALAIADAKRSLLKESLSVSQNNVDWLRVQVNNLTMDRAAIAAAKGIELPAPQIEGQLKTPEDVVRQAKDAPAGLVQLPDDLDSAMEKYSTLTGGFEDVGDEEAARQGIRHAEDGAVEYTR